MAKIYLSQLQKKYKFKEGSVRALNYRKLMRDIISNQSENLSRATLKLSEQNYNTQSEKLLKSKRISQRLSLPNIEQVLPKRSVFSKKGAIDGNIMTDNLRDRITKNLRNTLSEFKTKTGLPSYIKQSGQEKGNINPKVIKEFETKIRETFFNYTKNNPKLGMPNNIHTIAVTEMRSIINPIKHNYNMKLLEKNKDNFDLYKEWRQNKLLSKDPRIGHSRVNGQKIKADKKFKVPLIIKQGGRLRNLGITEMEYPHDSNAGADQVIGCNCDIIYFMVYKNKNKNIS